MENIKSKVAVLQRVNWRLTARIAVAALLISTVIWGCISTSNASIMRRKYTASRDAVGEALYGCIYMMAYKYNDAALAGADVEGDIMPAMREYYAQARALDDAIVRAFGEEAAVFTDALIVDLDRAFGAYEDAFRAGRSTEEAARLMTQAIADTRAQLERKFDANGRLAID
ncbi:MAG: hypothetical protein ACOYI5_02870 [Christensenellales bacterium]|jgi:hypothetical protein